MKTCCLLSLLLLLLVATANAARRLMRKSKSGDIFSASKSSSKRKNSTRRKRKNSTSQKRKSLSSKSKEDGATSSPSFQPTEFPTDQPTSRPSSLPTRTPSFVPTNTPTYVPTNTPTHVPSTLPTELPSASPIETDCANSFYEIDFEAPVHMVGERVRTNVGSAGPDAVVFGSPNVVSSYGTLDGQALEFNTVGNAPSFYYDQIRFALPSLSKGFLRLSFDFYSMKTVGTGVQLSVLFDTPTVNVITLTQGGTIMRFSPFVSSGTIGSYEDGTRYNLVVELDLQQRRWTIYLDGTSLGTYNFFLNDRIQSIRFSYGLRLASPLTPPSDVSIGVDNISICSSSSTLETTP